MRNIIRFAAAIVAVAVAGLFIYFNSPASEQTAHPDEAEKQDDKKAKNEFSVDLPDIDLDSNDAKGPDLDKLKRQAKAMHATVNHVAAEGAFDGEALNTGKIKNDLEKLNLQVEETKQGCVNCANDVVNYLNDLQSMTKDALAGDAQALGRLYTNLSEFDKELNGLGAIADIRDLTDLFDHEKAGPRFAELDDWIKEAKARLDRDTGDLQLDERDDLQRKRAELQERMKRADAATRKVNELVKQLKQKNLTEQKRKELEKKLTAARKEKDALEKNEEAVHEQWRELENRTANAKADREAFIRQVKEEADKNIAVHKNDEAGDQLVHIRDLADEMLKNKDEQQKKFAELEKAFADLHSKQSGK